MSWQDIRWSMPLGGKPRIVAANLSTHGPSSAPSVDVRNVWWLHFYPYTALLTIDGVRFPIRPGHVGVVPPGVRATYEYDEPGTHAVAHFMMPPAPQRPSVPIPAMQDLGEDFARWYTAFEEAIRWFPRNPERADVRLWDVLWRLADGPANESEQPLINREACFVAMQAIEARLAEPLRVSELVAESALSQSQLLRQFRDATGLSIHGYVHKRRMERAAQLLTETDLPVQTIAVMVGVPDRRLFNKMANRTFGCSPRAYRKAAQRG